MPFYDYQCQCGYAGEHIAKIEEKLDCPKCGQVMIRCMPFTHGINMGAAGAYGYYDDNLGCYISTNRQRKEEMRRQKITEKIGKGWI